MENRLKVLRAERSWSQQDLAEKLEVSRQSVNAIETGKYDPSLPLASILRREVSRARSEFRVSNIRTQTELVEQHTVRERLLAVLSS